MIQKNPSLSTGVVKNLLTDLNLTHSEAGQTRLIQSTMGEVVSVINNNGLWSFIRELSIKNASVLGGEAEEATLALTHCINDVGFSIIHIRVY